MVKKSNRFRAGILFFVLMFSAALLTACGAGNEDGDKGDSGDRAKSYAMGEIIQEQKAVDKTVAELMEDDQYTFEKAKVLVNPYKIAPLTALIIFRTEDETAISVTINGEEAAVTEAATSHAIPVYGMLDGKENKIVLTRDDGKTAEYTIETKAFEGDRMKVEKTSDALDDRLYFLSPNFVENCIYDKDGNLRWYVDGGYAGDIEFLDNGHFYISDPYQGTNGVKINYASFLEMDYLGKIYRQFITPFGYHHEFYPLSEDKMLLTGAKEGSPFLEAVLYTMDMKTGKAEYTLDMYDYLHKIAPEWVESLGTDFDFVLNSIDYDEESGDLLLSFRGIGVIARMNMESQEIKWMFGDPANLPEEFSPWLLKVTDETKYPYGEHCAIFTEDGNVAFHNNDADQFHMDSDLLTDYLDRYTTNVILEIDEEAKTVHSVWEYDADKKEFSKVGGMLTFYPNGNTLVDYGWSITQDAYENPEGISISDTEYLNGVLVELDENKEVLFRGTTKGLIFRAFKMRFYGDEEGTVPEIKNFSVEDYEKINGTEFSGKMEKSSDIQDSLNDAEPLDGSFEVLINRAMLETKMTKEDAVDILFVQGEDTYVYPYKEAGKEEYHGFNSDMYGIPVPLPDGEYDAYIRINDKYYDTGATIVF